MPRTLPPTPKRMGAEHPKPEPKPTRRAGRWTYDAELKRLRDETGQFSAGDDLLVDNLEPVAMYHQGYMMGWATTEWVRGMLERGLSQPCLHCGRIIGIADVEMVSDGA